MSLPNKMYHVIVCCKRPICIRTHNYQTLSHYQTTISMKLTIFSIYQISGLQFSRVLIGSRNLEYINNSLHWARKYARIFVRGHYLFLEAHIFPRANFLSIWFGKYWSKYPPQPGWWTAVDIYLDASHLGIYPHYSPPLRGIVVCYFHMARFRFFFVTDYM